MSEDKSDNIYEVCEHEDIKRTCYICAISALKQRITELEAQVEDFEKQILWLQEKLTEAISLGDAMKKEIKHWQATAGCEADGLESWKKHCEKAEAENAELRQRDEVWREKKEMLENDLAKAWKELADPKEKLKNVMLEIIYNTHSHHEAIMVASRELQAIKKQSDRKEREGNDNT